MTSPWVHALPHCNSMGDTGSTDDDHGDDDHQLAELITSHLRFGREEPRKLPSGVEMIAVAVGLYMFFECFMLYMRMRT